MTDDRSPSSDEERTPLGVLLWFGWAFILLAITGVLLPKIIDFVDFSPRAPFSLLGIFMMAELALVIFGITVALQRKRIAWRMAVLISFLFVPIGLVISAVLVGLLLRRSARAYFSED